MLQILPDLWLSFLSLYLVLLPNQISAHSTKSSTQALILWPSQSNNLCACRHVLIIHTMIGGSLLLNHNYWSPIVGAHGWGNLACWLSRKCGATLTCAPSHQWQLQQGSTKPPWWRIAYLALKGVWFDWNVYGNMNGCIKVHRMDDSVHHPHIQVA